MAPPSDFVTPSRGGVALALHDALERIEATVEQETAIMRQNHAIDIADFNLRKHQGLLEINRVLRNLAAVDREQIGRERVLRLVAKLEDNRQVLALHLKAVDEIAALLAQVLHDAESDGTYGAHGRVGG